jgi:hypothetical protein
MTARLTTNLVLGVALSAVAAGCTVHTYSARPEYPSTAFASQPTRYEASYRPDRRSHERDRPTADRPSTTRTEDDRVKHVATRDRDTKDTVRNRSSHNQGGSSATQGSSNAQKPRTDKKDEPVVLLPAKPEKAKTKTKRGGAQPFAERLKLLVDKKNEEIARKERERSAHMRKLGAAAVKND